MSNIIKQRDLDHEVLSKHRDMGNTILRSELMASILTYDEYSEMDTNDFLDMEVDKSIDGIGKASSIINDAITSNKNIALVTDYDVDGLTSLAVLFSFLVKIAGVPESKVLSLPNDRINGNGITDKLMETIVRHHKAKRIDLIITADHGSSNGVNVTKLRELGIEVVVTDHHQVPVENSAVTANAFVNPQRDKDSVYKYISGCGVAFMTVMNTMMKYPLRYDVDDESNRDVLYNIIGLVAISTIGDSMSMKDKYNRFLVKSGLRIMNLQQSVHFRAIRHVLGLTNNINETTLGFNVIPPINAASRMGVTSVALDFLLAKDDPHAIDGFRKLNRVNNERKKKQKELVKLANRQCILNDEPCNIIVLKSGVGINGIVSSQIGEQYGKPTITFIDNGETMSGSARAIIPEVNIYQMFIDLNKIDDRIFKDTGHGQRAFGGHKGASGCTIYSDKIDEFKNIMNQLMRNMGEVAEERTYLYNMKLSEEKLNELILEDISSVGPYGKDYEKPVFLSELIIHKVVLIGKDKEHALMEFNVNGRIIEATYFNFSNKTPRNILSRGNRVNVIYSPSLDTFNKKTKFKLMINFIDDTSCVSTIK